MQIPGGATSTLNACHLAFITPGSAAVTSAVPQTTAAGDPKSDLLRSLMPDGAIASKIFLFLVFLLVLWVWRLTLVVGRLETSIDLLVSVLEKKDGVCSK